MRRSGVTKIFDVAALAGAMVVASVGCLGAGAARADWLVLRDGARLETKGAWKVDGHRVLFTMPNGTLSTLRTDEIDLDQSALATTQAREALLAPPPIAIEKKEPVLRLTERDIPPVGAAAMAAMATAADEAAEPGKEGDGKDKAKDAEPSPLEVISWEKTENSATDGLEIFGTIKNGSPNIITTPTLMVAIYDADGGLLATNSGEVNSPQIQPGKTANFRIAFPGIPDFASVKFDAQGRGFKPRIENAEGDETAPGAYEEPSDMSLGGDAGAQEPPSN